jgi:hypothetical protein
VSTRTGKIARLPFQIREELNTKLRDGVTAPTLIKWLAQLGKKGISEQNITNWRQGGFQDWLKQEERNEAIRIQSEASLSLVKALQGQGSSLEEANSVLMASKIGEVLQDYDTVTLKELLKEKPDKIISLAFAINGQAGERSKREGLELKVRQYEDKLKKIREAVASDSSKKKGGGLTKETLATIEKELSL